MSNKWKAYIDVFPYGDNFKATAYKRTGEITTEQTGELACDFTKIRTHTCKAAEEAIAAMEKLAKEFGIELEWEENYD